MNKIILKDVVEGLKELEDECADVVLIDPPYNIGKDFGTSKYDMSMKEYTEWADEWMQESVRILKPSGTIYVYGFPEILAHLSVRLDLPKRWLSWHYTNKTVPRAKFWQRSYESIICAWKDEKQRVFNKDDVREPYTEDYVNNFGGDKKKVRANTKGRFQKTDKKTEYKVNDKGALPRDVIKVPALAGAYGTSERAFLCRTCDEVYLGSELKQHRGHDVLKHPTQKPYKLTERLLKASRTDDTFVVIPFSGSGSEAKVAKDLGMRFVGFDINPEYVRISNKLLE